MKTESGDYGYGVIEDRVFEVNEGVEFWNAKI
jgi:hypothetical protein